jgi:hypothetical protein
MAKAYGLDIEAKIKKGSMYLTFDKRLVRITVLNRKDNRVDIRYYDDSSVQTIEFDTAHLFLEPLFQIQEVARMFNKATDTLRKYERMGILPRCPQYEMGGKRARLYSMNDIMEVAEALAQRRPVGRPPSREINLSKVNQRDMVDGILKRYRRKQ